MTCAKCGCMMEAVDIPEATDSGSFTEEWKCSLCGAKEYVSGKEQEPPKDWDHWGEAA